MFALGFFFIACASKTNTTFNQPATYWYSGIFKNIRVGDLESADNNFTSLQSEHINSPLLPEAMLALGQAHMYNSEYLLSDFYFNEYTKRYGNPNNFDYIAFLKLKARYLSIKTSAKDQAFMTDTLSLVQDFFDRYPNSRYTPYVQEIEIQFTLGTNELNKAIARVYKKAKKPKAVAIYDERIDDVLNKEAHAKPSKIPWYKWILNW
ncbi:outer membrane protein assembly factor BamD [Helicobacter sp. 11S02629-2]|uniref:outer membrane protein assembly factor BamD n=1 Tax=Helicobacter sp. 11S02629-2 TaxID=1476195 RepID=UPI000BA556E8|nr:outer membrane protein assembly factor BamD [Helicobacter sp. 11S02629-2]PAF44114.1 outer membrane protein assembly factor BamD [Helicobacter sp. 11S02629-2]